MIPDRFVNTVHYNIAQKLTLYLPHLILVHVYRLLNNLYLSSVMPVINIRAY